MSLTDLYTVSLSQRSHYVEYSLTAVILDVGIRIVYSLVPDPPADDSLPGC